MPTSEGEERSSACNGICNGLRTAHLTEILGRRRRRAQQLLARQRCEDESDRRGHQCQLEVISANQRSSVPVPREVKIVQWRRSQKHLLAEERARLHRRGMYRVGVRIEAPPQHDVEGVVDVALLNKRLADDRYIQ